jgi:hypothetical protein
MAHYYNLKYIIDDLKEIERNHLQINSFGTGDIKQLIYLTQDQNKTDNTTWAAPLYPLLYVIPGTITLKYENLDINPEGIGVQPMICDVSLSFDIIGGMGLKEPVDKLQNALSFSYYANTEMYDERATPTEDTTAIDQAVFEAILNQTPVVGVNSVGDVNQINGGNPFGSITKFNLSGSSETGDINYQKQFDDLLTSTKGYFDGILNSLEQIIKDYGWATEQMFVKTDNRRFKTGNYKNLSGTKLA